MYVCRYACKLLASMYSSVYACIQMYMYVHTHTHTHTHVCNNKMCARTYTTIEFIPPKKRHILRAHAFSYGIPVRMHSCHTRACVTYHIHTRMPAYIHKSTRSIAQGECRRHWECEKREDSNQRRGRGKGFWAHSYWGRT